MEEGQRDCYLTHSMHHYRTVYRTVTYRQYDSVFYLHMFPLRWPRSPRHQARWRGAGI